LFASFLCLGGASETEDLTTINADGDSEMKIVGDSSSGGDGDGDVDADGVEGSSNNKRASGWSLEDDEDDDNAEQSAQLVPIDNSVEDGPLLPMNQTKTGSDESSDTEKGGVFDGSPSSPIRHKRRERSLSVSIGGNGSSSSASTSTSSSSSGPPSSSQPSHPSHAVKTSSSSSSSGSAPSGSTATAASVSSKPVPVPTNHTATAPVATIQPKGASNTAQQQQSQVPTSSQSQPPADPDPDYDPLEAYMSGLYEDGDVAEQRALPRENNINNGVAVSISASASSGAKIGVRTPLMPEPLRPPPLAAPPSSSPTGSVSGESARIRNPEIADLEQDGVNVFGSNFITLDQIMSSLSGSGSGSGSNSGLGFNYLNNSRSSGKSIDDPGWESDISSMPPSPPGSGMGASSFHGRDGNNNSSSSSSGYTGSVSRRKSRPTAGTRPRTRSLLYTHILRIFITHSYQILPQYRRVCGDEGRDRDRGGDRRTARGTRGKREKGVYRGHPRSASSRRESQRNAHQE
jgi:hypothetical protein